MREDDVIKKERLLNFAKVSTHSVPVVSIKFADFLLRSSTTR
jgi:hypothetical protein